jgi:cyclopropane fatty-acyl-phospholipid synthase-like methyltransferase
MLTKEDITTAYRLFLGRDPENQDVVNNLQQTIKSYQQMRDHFLQSHEFLQMASEFLGEQQHMRLRHPLLPYIPVEVNVSDEVLTVMFTRIHKEWDILSHNQPYWAILTQNQYYLTHFNDHRAEFYASGAYAAEIFLAALRRNQINPKQLQSCLDYGCGVGRVTKFLAKQFPSVIGVDISQNFLDKAKETIDNEKITNVSFMLCDRPQYLETLRSVDAIFSIITLQHNAPPVIAWTIKKLLAALNPGGVAYFQVSTYRSGYLFEAERYLNSNPPDTLEMHSFPQHEVFKIVSDLNCACLEVREDGMTSEEHFTLSNTFLVQKKPI